MTCFDSPLSLFPYLESGSLLGKHGCLLLVGAGAAASSSLLRPGAGGQGGYDRVQRPAQGKQLSSVFTANGAQDGSVML